MAIEQLSGTNGCTEKYFLIHKIRPQAEGLHPNSISHLSRQLTQNQGQKQNKEEKNKTSNVI